MFSERAWVGDFFRFGVGECSDIEVLFVEER